MSNRTAIMWADELAFLLHAKNANGSYVLRKNNRILVILVEKFLRSL